MKSPMLESSPQASFPGTAIRQAFWRLHFYAGLLVMPVLMLMALTGGLYLFQEPIEAAVYRPLLNVADRPAATAPQAWADAALAAVSGRLIQVSPPQAQGRSARLVIETDGRGRRAVYIDPHDARVLGSTPQGGTMDWAALHSLDLAGRVANLLVEVVAGWAIVMVATGIVLWWPAKGPHGERTGGQGLRIRSGPGKRLFWRDSHAVIGLFAGAVIVFLAATGMPWSAFWGKEVRTLTNQAGWGRPAAPAADSTWEHAAHQGATPWTLQDSQVHDMAGMDMDGMDHMAPAPLDLDQAVAAVDEAGLGRPYVLTLPGKPGAAWIAAYMPAKVEKTRTLYLAPGDGHLLGDVGYDRFGPAAKAIEWGISVHQGRQFGWLNQLVMLAGCISVWLLGISALVMWWKRRPAGGFGAPRAPADLRAWRGVALVVTPLAIFYPLVGASMLILIPVDLAVRRLARR